MYFVKTPEWLKKIYSSFIWQVPTDENILYLTFDDGPHEKATTFALDELKKYDAKATFFCIGKNVVEHPDIYRRIINERHLTGNHTHNHLNGWKTKDEAYVNNVIEASKYIDSKLFRPPYGRITTFQSKILQKVNDKRYSQNTGFKIIMWSVLSGDFDVKLSPEKCLKNVISHTAKGAIIVFHDSEKAWPRMQFALPKVLEFFTEKGFQFKSILQSI